MRPCKTLEAGFALVQNQQSMSAPSQSLEEQIAAHGLVL